MINILRNDKYDYITEGGYHDSRNVEEKVSVVQSYYDSTFSVFSWCSITISTC